MVSTFQMQSFYRTAPLAVDTTAAQKFFEEDDANILDENILDQTAMESGLEMSPPMVDSRRDSFAPSSAFLSPKTEEWSVEMQAIPSNNPFSSNNPFVQPQQPFAPTQSWPIANGSGTCTPFDPISEFDNSSALFHRPMQGQTPFSNPGGVTMFSPVNAPNPSLPTSPHNIPKRMRPSSPAIRSHNELRRGDGIRKKNARFDIPAERTLSNIDQLISQSTDEQEIKELKQQKRLLRNRQAALDSRQRKKQHTERLEDEKKQFTALVGDMEEEIASLRKQLENAHLVNRQLEEENIKLRIDSENLIASHTLETGELRKKVSVLTSHVQRLEISAMTSTNTSDSNFSSAFNDMNDMAMEGAWNSMGFLDDFAMDTDVKQEQQLVPVKKQEPSDLEKPASQGGLLFMLFLVGAFVLSNRSSASPTIPRVSEDVRAASATLLDNIFKEAGVGQSGIVEAMAPRPSGTASSWTAVPSVPAVGAMDGVAPSMLGELADSLTQPTEEQANEQLFGLSAEQYNSINGQDFMQTTPERPPSQARRNLAEALVAMRSNSKQSTAEVYTRSLLWDQIPSEVVRDFAKMVAECKSTGCD